MGRGGTAPGGRVYNSVTPDNLFLPDNVVPAVVAVFTAHITWVRSLLGATGIRTKGRIPTRPDRELEGGVQ